MTSKPFGDDIRILLRRAEDAGWRLDRRRNGIIMAYPPNGQRAFAIHGTYGSPKALKTLRRNFERGGLEVRS